MKYILRPHYSDMNVVVLGTSLQSALKSLKRHWEDVIEYPSDYEKKYVDSVKHIIYKEYETIEQLMRDYNKLIDEDYSFDEQ